MPLKVESIFKQVSSDIIFYFSVEIKYCHYLFKLTIIFPFPSLLLCQQMELSVRSRSCNMKVPISLLLEPGEAGLLEDGRTEGCGGWPA